jgi:hypothetical protein
MSELSLGINDLKDDIFFVEDLFYILYLPYEEFYLVNVKGLPIGKTCVLRSLIIIDLEAF